MMGSLLIIVVLASIVAFFSKEFTGLLKKFFSIPGSRLIIPLIILSCLIELYEDVGFRGLAWIHHYLHALHGYLASIVPLSVSTGSSLSHLLILLLAGLVPLVIFEFMAQQRKYMRVSWSFRDSLVLLLWIVAVILLAIPKDYLN